MTLTHTVSSLARDAAAAASDLGSQAAEIGSKAAGIGSKAVGASSDAVSSVVTVAADLASTIAHRVPGTARRRRAASWPLIGVVVAAVIATWLWRSRRRRSLNAPVTFEAAPARRGFDAPSSLDGLADGLGVATPI